MKTKTLWMFVFTALTIQTHAFALDTIALAPNGSVVLGNYLVTCSGANAPTPQVPANDKFNIDTWGTTCTEVASLINQLKNSVSTAMILKASCYSSSGNYQLAGTVAGVPTGSRIEFTGEICTSEFYMSSFSRVINNATSDTLQMTFTARPSSRPDCHRVTLNVLKN